MGRLVTIERRARCLLTTTYNTIIYMAYLPIPSVFDMDGLTACWVASFWCKLSSQFTCTYLLCDPVVRQRLTSMHRDIWIYKSMFVIFCLYVPTGCLSTSQQHSVAQKKQYLQIFGLLLLALFTTTRCICATRPKVFWILLST
mmetsp:Transcript_5384/g.7525  ORF Transcript_5384/g.7525 Transcript_5384/m.7525 type:complete len:143 (-) Transcript_5384:315-743(-)